MNYKHLHKSLADIARELNVDAVVEGTILRSGERIRIAAQLIRVPADEHLWAQSFEGNLGDTLTLQSAVAQAVTNRIRVTLSSTEHAALQKSRPVNVEAYDAYLKGRYYWNQRTREGLTQAIEYFKRSIALEPSNAKAYAGLADFYALSGDWEYGALAPSEAFARAKEAAYKALSLDDSLSEAHTSLAFVLDLWSVTDDASQRRRLRNAVEQSRQLQSDSGSCRACSGISLRSAQIFSVAQNAHEIYISIWLLSQLQISRQASCVRCA